MHELFGLSREIVGLEESEAISKIEDVGGLYQIEERDDNAISVMDGFRDDRLTIKLKKGVVIEAYIY